jgi:DNA-binding MarR family transcriptional regulator
MSGVMLEKDFRKLLVESTQKGRLKCRKLTCQEVRWNNTFTFGIGSSTYFFKRVTMLMSTLTMVFLPALQ